MKTNRNQLLQLYGHLYSFHAPLFQPPGCCFYCGDLAGTVDHVPPLAYAELLKASEIRYPFVLVTACSACNAKLGSKPLFRLLDRVDFIRTWLDEAYERAVTLWSEAEIEEMSPRFQKSLRARKAQYTITMNRLRWAEKREMEFSAYPDDEWL